METEPEPETDEPCWVLERDVPYVVGWMDAAGALAVLRDELAACGLDALIPYARPEVTVAGVGVVELGRITPATARRLAALLALARDESAPGASATGATAPETGSAGGGDCAAA